MYYYILLYLNDIIQVTDIATNYLVSTYETATNLAVMV